MFFLQIQIPQMKLSVEKIIASAQFEVNMYCFFHIFYYIFHFSSVYSAQFFCNFFTCFIFDISL